MTIETTPEIAARLAARKEDWRRAKGQAKVEARMQVQTVVCGVCAKPSVWYERKLEKHVPPGSAPSAEPVNVLVEYRYSSPMQQRPHAARAHAACIAETKPTTHRKILWDEQVPAKVERGEVG